MSFRTLCFSNVNEGESDDEGFLKDLFQPADPKAVEEYLKQKELDEQKKK